MFLGSGGRTIAKIQDGARIRMDSTGMWGVIEDMVIEVVNDAAAS